MDSGALPRLFGPSRTDRFAAAFLWNGKTYGQICHDAGSSAALSIAPQVVLRAVLSEFGRRLRAAQRQPALSPELKSELGYQIHDIEERLEIPLSGDGEGGATDACALQAAAGYLGAEGCEIRWSVERQMAESSRELGWVLDGLDPQARSCFEQAVRCYEGCEFGLARERFEKFLSYDATSQFAYQYLGLIAVVEDQPEEAVRQFQLAAKFANALRCQAHALSHLARAHAVLGRLAAALEIASNAAELCHEEPSVWFQLAEYAALTGQASRAVPAIGRAVASDPAYWGAAVASRVFEPLSRDIQALFDGLRRQEIQRAEKAFHEAERSVAAIRQVAGMPPADAAGAAALRQRCGEANVFLLRAASEEIHRWRAGMMEEAGQEVERRIAEKKSQLTSLEGEKMVQIANQSAPLSELHARLTELHTQFERRTSPSGYQKFLIAWVLMAALAASMGMLGSPGLAGMFLAGSAVAVWLAYEANKWFRMQWSVRRPASALEKQIVEREEEFQEQIARIEEQFAQRQSLMEAELSELEKRLANCVAAANQGNASYSRPAG